VFVVLGCRGGTDCDARSSNYPDGDASVRLIAATALGLIARTGVVTMDDKRRRLLREALQRLSSRIAPRRYRPEKILHARGGS
jgi:hypothetical protein